jgi:hypothetical protein
MATKTFTQFRVDNVVTTIPTTLEYGKEVYYKDGNGALTLYVGDENGDAQTVGGGGGAVTSVNGQTGVVVLTKSNVDLSNVDNTSDLNKPISTATQAVIDDLLTPAVIVEEVHPFFTAVSTESPTATSPTRNYAMMPTAQKLATGRWIRVFRLGVSHQVSLNSIIAVQYSDNEGESWVKYDGTSGYDILANSASRDYRNTAIIVTSTGRILVFFNSNTGSAWDDHLFTYSDDNGATWATLATAKRVGGDTWATASGVGDAYGVEGPIHEVNGVLYFAYHLVDASVGWVTKMGFAKSEDNGLEWDLEYGKIYEHLADNTAQYAEPRVAYLGGGRWVGVARQLYEINGLNLPLIFFGTDYGTMWAGDNATLTKTDVESGLRRSGLLAIEGAGQTLGYSAGSDFNAVLPDVQYMNISGNRLIVIPYWIRRQIKDAVEYNTEQRICVIELSDYIDNGIDCTKKYETIYDPTGGVVSGTANRNGGNTTCMKVGADLVLVSYHQTSGTATNGTTFLWDLPCRSSDIIALYQS